MMRNCYTCQYQYLSGPEFACEMHGIPRYTCDDWTAKPGIWVPVTKALPGDCEKVTALIAKVDGVVWVDTVDATFVAGAFVFDDTDREGYQVTHWMRQPKKPGTDEIRKILMEASQ